MTITRGRHVGATGVVDSAVIQGTFDYTDEFSPEYQVAQDTGSVVTVR